MSIRKKTVNDIIHYMNLNNLDIVFNEVYKVGELILIFPWTTATAKRNFPAFKSIKIYLRVT